MDLKDDKIRPEWFSNSSESSDKFTTFISEGVSDVKKAKDRSSNNIIKRRKLTLDDYVRGILDRDRSILARAITLVESNSKKHEKLAKDLIKSVYPYSGNSIRVGITGTPGAGKSTFIDILGSRLCENGRKVAVLAVDPSSQVSGGSILGDKTRMEKLLSYKNSFIRPSPSSGNLGGVTRKSRETIILCEAFGFDTILVETVGVGQNETKVRSMVDFFLLVLIPGGGDELQGIKKGVVELADSLLINKADGENRIRAKVAREEYARALHYLIPATEGYFPGVYTASSITGEGIDEIWKVIEKFKIDMKKSGVFEKRRNSQLIDWVFSMIEDYLIESFYQNQNIKDNIPKIKNDVINGKLTAAEAAQKLLDFFYKNK